MLRGACNQSLPLSSHSVEKIKRSSLRPKPGNAIYGASLALITFLVFFLISSYRSKHSEVPPSVTQNTERLASVARSVRGKDLFGYQLLSVASQKQKYTSKGGELTAECNSKTALAELRREPLKSVDPVPLADVKARTLVLYVYASSDPEYEKNLQYFLREGVQVSLSYLSSTPPEL